MAFSEIIQNGLTVMKSTSDSVGFSAISLKVGDHIQVQCSPSFCTVLCILGLIYTGLKLQRNPFNSIKHKEIRIMVCLLH